jgi:hypothetical protein
MKLEVKMRGGGALQPGPTGPRQGAPDPGPSAAAAPPPLPDMSGWSLSDLSSALGDPDAKKHLASLKNDTRAVTLADEEDDEGFATTIGELATEAIKELD